MRRGGIHDPLAGTFHRYATDRVWHVPHFEKTLYDNAQLAALYLEASRVLSDPALENVGRAVLDDLLGAWQRPDGGLIVGFDADDPVGEGAYYTFTPAELTQALGPADARLVGALFGVTAAGDEPAAEACSIAATKPRSPRSSGSPPRPSKTPGPAPGLASSPSARSGPRRPPTTRSSPGGTGSP